jgi:hypothetical protein
VRPARNPSRFYLVPGDGAELQGNLQACARSAQSPRPGLLQLTLSASVRRKGLQSKQKALRRFQSCETPLGDRASGWPAVVEAVGLVAV